MTDLTASTRWTEWPDWELRLAQPADGRAVAIAAAGGAAFDLGIRAGVVSIGGLLAALVACTGLLVSGRLLTASSRVCIGGALVLAAFLPLRTSPWIVPLDLLAIAGLLALAAMVAREGRLADLSIALVASRAVLASLHAVASAGFLAAPARRWLGGVAVPERREGFWRAGRGVLIALPVVAVLGALLASADAVFASFLRVDIHLPRSAAGHLVLGAIGALALGAVLRTASADPSAPVPPVPWRLGALEWTIVLSGVISLFTGFATVQVIAAAGGARHVLDTEGLTYADYARTGYFQLIAVAVLTGLLLGGMRAVAERSAAREHRRFTILAEVIVLLTFLILLVAVRRLGLYEDAYGWTMLRLVAKAGAVWLGGVLVLLAVRLAGVGSNRAWFVPAAAALGLAVLVALNVANPEAAVVRHNLARAGHGADIDPAYLANLSDDAVPALVARIDTVPPDQRAAVVWTVCSRRDRSASGPLGWNRSAAAAQDALATICP